MKLFCCGTHGFWAIRWQCSSIVLSELRISISHSQNGTTLGLHESHRENQNHLEIILILQQDNFAYFSDYYDIFDRYDKNLRQN